MLFGGGISDGYASRHIVPMADIIERTHVLVKPISERRVSVGIAQLVVGIEDDWIRRKRG